MFWGLGEWGKGKRYYLLGGTLFVDDEFMGVSRPTEMTVRDLLQEELPKRGVTAVS